MRNKPRSLVEYIQYRTTILVRAKARTSKFKDSKENYYWYRLREIDEQFPEFSKFGEIHLKV